MKKVINVEKLDLTEIVKKGLSVRDQVVQEFKDAREKMSSVDWQNEVETFRKNPLDAAQGYLNQVSEALKNRGETVSNTESKAVATAPVKKKAVAKKKTTRAASPRKAKPKTTSTRRATSTRTKKTSTKSK